MEDKKFDALYKKANRLVNKKNNDACPADMLGVMQEINTYRTELDMQNDELQKTQLELEESRDKYIALYNLAPIANLTIDEDDTILEANTASIKLFKAEKNLKGMRLSTFITSGSQDVLYLHKQKVFETMKKQSCELAFRLQDGTTFNGLLQSVAIKEKNKRSIHMAITDLAELKKK